MAEPTRRLPLNALRTFEAAARHLSFKAAAAELCVSATTVSNQIRRLEADWDRKLFHRRTRAVELTDSGRSMARVLTRAFDDIRDEVERQGLQARKTVSLAVGPIFGSRWLGPRLARFGRDHPEIQLVITQGGRLEGAEQMVSDIAVDWGLGYWPGLEARLLMRVRYAPVASPALLAQYSTLSEPAALAALPIIHQYDRSEWQNWFALAGCPQSRFPREVVIVDSNLVERAVQSGQGVALGVFPFLDEDLRNDQLIKPFDIDLHPTRAYYLLTRTQARKRREVRTVCEWIEAQVAEEEGSAL